MEIRKWLENLKKEKKRKKLVLAAKDLEAKADASWPMKRLPNNGGVNSLKKKKKLYHDFFFLCRIISKS